MKSPKSYWRDGFALGKKSLKLAYYSSKNFSTFGGFKRGQEGDFRGFAEGWAIGGFGIRGD